MHSSLSSAAPWRTDGCMAPIFTLEDKNTETEAGCLSLLPVCKEEVSPEQQERSSSLVLVKLEPLQIKEEQQEEFIHSPEEAAGSTLTLLAVKSEDDDNENRDTERLASTSTEHMKTQAYIEYVVPSSQPTNDQLLSSHRPSHRCTECGKPHGHIPCLKSHMRVHTGHKPFACYKCSQLFDDRSLLKEHMSSHIMGAKCFICTECGKEFVFMSRLKTHMRAHAGEKCGRAFSGRRGLKQHMHTHTGSKTLTSTVHTGNKPFAVPQLKSHMRFHTGEKPFSCYQCGQVFDDRMTGLKEHMSSHRGERLTNFSDCGKVFVIMGSLKQHMRTHTGSKNSTVNSKGFGLKPEPLQIKEEQQEELLQRPEEAAGSTLTSLAVRCEDDGNENRDTEPVASTSTEHMKTQADVEDRGASSQPTSDQLLSSRCSESDITDDSDDWEETREGQSASNKLNSKPFQDLKSSKQTPSMRRCTECGRGFGYMGNLKLHMMTHASDLKKSNLKQQHMFGRNDTGGKLFSCTACDKVFSGMCALKQHLMTHTSFKPSVTSKALV